jgi:uncharacterized membrane protein YdjX (TVP38/TMEM64 family)
MWGKAVKGYLGAFYFGVIIGFIYNVLCTLAGEVIGRWLANRFIHF